MAGLWSVAFAAELDVAGVGRDLNGWQGGTARYAVAGASFGVARPDTARDDAGNLLITMPVSQVRGRTPVYEAAIRLTVSPDGLVRVVSVAGRVNGREFESGEVRRPEVQVLEEVPEANDLEETEVAAPVDVEAEMRGDLAERLTAALDRAREEKKAVKRDLSAWLFTKEAAESAALVEGTQAAVEVLFRRTAR